MATEDLYGSTFDCECGRTHSVQPSHVIYAPDAAAQLPDLAAGVAERRRAAVLFDQRTRGAGGEAVAEALARAGWDVRLALVEDGDAGQWPVCDQATRRQLGPQVEGASLIVAAGSGVVSDLGKWLAFDADVPLITFATAASMNGYASANVAPSVGGVKTLRRARPPVAVASSPAVLASAPDDMTAAGLGDVLAKSTSSVDWYLNHKLFGDYYCPRSVTLVAEVEGAYLDRPEALRRGDPSAVEGLFHALLLTGVAMTLAETSAPASGGEHLISHTLDMLAASCGAEHDLHGRQVGLGTILCAELYRRVLAVESPTWDIRPIRDKADPAFWSALTDGVAEPYAQKRPRLDAAREALREGSAWDDLRADLAARCPSPERIRTALAEAGGAVCAEHIRTARPYLARVFAAAHQMRPRFTILDLARIVGVMPADAEEIVADWA